MIYSTPDIFLTKTNHSYPPGNNQIFEEFFYSKFLKETIGVNRIYLPIHWTNFYISRNYATNDISDLQNFLDAIPRDKKYFTIIQWDDGIKNNLLDLDIKVFASGGIGDYPIPLINQPYKRIDKERNIFASFMGSTRRHPIRQKMFSLLNDKPGYFISGALGFESFKDTMERSIFALCPRGYGKTSFRINEALNLGAIPVYMYDDPWIPFNDKIDFKEYGILIHESEIENIDNILKSISDDEINRLRDNGKKIYENYYLYEACYSQILSILINE